MDNVPESHAHESQLHFRRNSDFQMPSLKLLGHSIGFDAGTGSFPSIDKLAVRAGEEAAAAGDAGKGSGREDGGFRKSRPAKTRGADRGEAWRG